MYDRNWQNAQYANFSRAAGCTTLACLRAAPLGTIVAATNAAYSNAVTTAFDPVTFYWGPVVDGKIIPYYPSDAFALGKFAKVPVLVDREEYELLSFVDINVKTRALFDLNVKVLWQNASDSFVQNFTNMYQQPQFGASTLYDVPYVTSHWGNAALIDPFAQWVYAGSDILIDCWTRHMAASVAKAGVPAYKFIFNLGSETHAATLPYIFSDAADPYGDASTADGSTSISLRDWFVSFTVHLDPKAWASGRALTPKIPRYDTTSSPQVFNMGKTATGPDCRPMVDPDVNARCDFLIWSAPLRSINI